MASFVTPILKEFSKSVEFSSNILRRLANYKILYSPPTSSRKILLQDVRFVIRLCDCYGQQC